MGFEEDPGGSSGGSAVAVSTALSLASVGTDTGGSIRIPAAAGGWWATEADTGSGSSRGIIPLSFSQDHAGPLSPIRSRRALCVRRDRGRDREDPDRGRRRDFCPTESSEGSRVNGFGGCRNSILQSLAEEVGAMSSTLKTLEALGAKNIELNPKLMDETESSFLEIVVGRSSTYHWKWLNEEGGLARMSDPERRIGQLSRTYLDAQQRRAALCGVFEQVVEWSTYWWPLHCLSLLRA